MLFSPTWCASCEVDHDCDLAAKFWVSQGLSFMFLSFICIVHQHCCMLKLWLCMQMP